MAIDKAPSLGTCGFAVGEVTEDAPEGSSAAEAAAQDPPPPVRSAAGCDRCESSASLSC